MMDIYKFVENINDIFANIDSWEDARSDRSRVEFSYFKDILVRSETFIPYSSTDGTAFIPSRFAGLKDNDVLKQFRNRPIRVGNETTYIISEILGHEAKEPSKSRKAEFIRFYEGHCAKEYKEWLRPRKFWREIIRTV